MTRVDGAERKTIEMLVKNGVYIVQGELNHVVAALRRSSRWSGGHYHQVNFFLFDIPLAWNL